MNFNVFVALTVNGLAMGVIYALLAMGLILLIRAVGVMNFAQGDLLMLGAYITCWLTVDLELPFWLMVLVALLCFAVVGLIFMFQRILAVAERFLPGGHGHCDDGSVDGAQRAGDAAVGKPAAIHALFGQDRGRQRGGVADRQHQPAMAVRADHSCGHRHHGFGILPV